MMIASYKNGDYKVSIYNDGTKVREWNKSNPSIEFPESIDMKITDYCDAGCPFCHEKSTVSGKHSSYFDVIKLIGGLPPGVEIAIGGGNPLDHPELDSILWYMRSVGLIANITVNEKHLNSDTINRINLFRKENLIHGLGVSLDNGMFGIGFNEVADENTVAHVIAGVHDPSILRVLLHCDEKVPVKVLVLGYKDYGRGGTYYNSAHENVTKKIDKWRYFLPSFINSKSFIMSFDNLALKQLGVQDMIHNDLWNDIYMGDDGQFTMYVDAVNMEYSLSSTSNRFGIDENNIIDIFSKINLHGK